MTQQTKVIDFHAHVLHPDVYAQTVNHCVASAFGALPRDEHPRSTNWPNFLRQTDSAVQLADMDARGIDLAVISSSTVSQSTFWADAEQAAHLDRLANIRIAEWVERHPNRFRGAFTVPLQSIEHAVAELRFCRETLGLRTVNLPACVDGRYLGDRGFLPLWEAIVDLGVVAFVHPDGIKDPAFQKFSLWNGIGQGLEETRVMASIIYEGLFERFPALTIVMAHAGGYLPLFIARLDRNATAHPPSMVNLSRKPSTYLRNFYYDTVTYDPTIIEALSARVGADRIVFGSDYPFGDDEPLRLIEQCALDDAQRRLILTDNAAGLLS